MVDLPENGEGLSWIASHDPAGLQLIPGLQPASIAAAAGGDQQALAYLRFTAQHHAAYPGGSALNDFDRALLQASEATPVGIDTPLLRRLLHSDPQAHALLRTRSEYTMQRFAEAISQGRLDALMWLRALCLITWSIFGLDVTQSAAKAGQLSILKFLRSGPKPADWGPDTVKAALPHLECLKWLLSKDTPGGPCHHFSSTLSDIAKCYGLPALESLHARWSCLEEYSDETLLATAVELGDRPMVAWLKAQNPTSFWDSTGCERAADQGDISMLGWLRTQDPPCPWDDTVTSAAAGKDLKTLQWLRSQAPPCPWAISACAAAAKCGKLEVLIWLRSQDPPCLWNETCPEAAACQPDVEIMQWLSDNHGLAEPREMLQCASNAARRGNLAMLKWLSGYGVPLTGDLYSTAAQNQHSHILKFLHSREVSPPTTTLRPSMYLIFQVPFLMFCLDIGLPLHPLDRRRAQQARMACCLFHGLVRWCRQALSDPSRKAHLAFDGMANDRSGQMLLMRLSQLPPELISKIAVAAELQHNMFDASA